MGVVAHWIDDVRHGEYVQLLVSSAALLSSQLHNHQKRYVTSIYSQWH